MTDPIWLFAFAVVALWLALEIGVRVSKWWAWQRTRRQQERWYLQYRKNQQRLIQRQEQEAEWRKSVQ